MPAKVFVSYSHKDRALKDKLLAHLTLLQEEGTISTWQDKQIVAGSEFDAEIIEELHSADIILLLISADFLASPYCRSVEMKRALQRHAEGSARVIPVILRKCDWENGPFAKLLVAPTDGKAVTSWRNRDEAFTDVAKHIRKAATAKRASMPSLISNLPPRNPNFTGRKDLLARLDTALKTDRTAAVVQALWGLGGVGKSQLPIEHAYEHIGEYTIAWWIRADQSTTLAADYAALAGPLQLPERNAAGQNTIVQAVQRQLESTVGWLLIFDNVEKPEDVQPFLPLRGQGHVIVTSRYPAWRSIAEAIEVDVMHRDDAIELLLGRSGTDDRAAADRLADALGDLPIALEQAAAYVERTEVSLADYLELFTTRRKELWTESASRETRTVSATWNLAIEKIAATNRAAADLLTLYAFLAPDDIPRALLHSVDADAVPETLRGLAANKLLMNDAVAALRDYSLVSATPEFISVHRLVQFVVRDRLSAEEEREWAKGSFRITSLAMPADPKNSQLWPRSAVLVPHVRRSLEIATELKLEDHDVFAAGSRAANYLTWRAEFHGAAALLETMTQFFTDESLVAQARNMRATVDDALGNHDTALATYRETLQFYRETYGEVNLHVAHVLNQIGSALLRLRRDEEAAEVLREAQDVYARNGTELPWMKQIITSNLAVAWLNMDEKERARDAMQDVLKYDEQLYGEDNAAVITSRVNFGRVLIEAGEHEAGHAQLTRALRAACTTFGERHPTTCRIRFVIASDASLFGNLDGAAAHVDQAVAGFTAAFGARNVEAFEQVRLFVDEARKANRPDLVEKYAKVAEDLRPING